jgi:hypothetical protein
MRARPRRRSRDERPRTAARVRQVDEGGHHASPTAVAAEALRTGILPKHARKREESPRMSELLLGDPDDRILANAYVGDETPGGTSPTPDQNGVDEIGRAYGLQEEDSGALRSAAEVLGRRDRRRDELQPPRRPQP